MTNKLKFTGLAGSLRTESYSLALLRSIGRLSGDDTEMNIIDIADFPLYNQDLEKNNLPLTVTGARESVAESDAVIIVTPEFNHGIPGVLKNALDWLSRPAFNNHMVGKSVFFITQSPGALGGVRAQYQLRETLSAMLCNMIPLPEIAVSNVSDKVSDGILTDERTLSYIKTQLDMFISNISVKSAG